MCCVEFVGEEEQRENAVKGFLVEWIGKKLGVITMKRGKWSNARREEGTRWTGLLLGRRRMLEAAAIVGRRKLKC